MEHLPGHSEANVRDAGLHPHAVSVEPGLSVTPSSITAFVTVPVAVYRNRLKSVPDEIDDPILHTLGNGDAAFADYLFLLGISRRL